ncbi:hypothetical protein GCM10007868_28450 [Gluconobacter frateurii]|uniref:EF-hand domain-containing protein n=2 Tax=Gluconobacter frateurii TaxID=38308 RepID=A0ABQ0Q9H2_9PROT|nr:hypothetical protein AA0228_0863 [Gluconobacter frateurii NRIC 0228]GLP91770.1 hypothetical protein GCM10007868_28450 [Gluconobacter frateurii]
MNMTRIASFAAIVLLAVPASAFAHRLDEYLQATTLNITHSDISLHLRLTPGVDVAEGVIGQIDRNGDGNLSLAEQVGYVSRVTRGLSLSINGRPSQLIAGEAYFPSVAAMKAGTGTIDIHLRAVTEFQKGKYRLIYRNRGSGLDTVWLVNCLFPQDTAIHVLQQGRSEDQSSYTLDFSVSAL